MISLGLSLGLRTVAEGIEDQSQTNLLGWQGCQLGQGYLYGRAVPIAELAKLLARPHPFPGMTAEVPASMSGPFLSLEAQPTERFSQLRAIYDAAPVGLAFINTQLRYVNLNQRLAQSNGKNVQAHLGLKVSEVVDPALFAQVQPYLTQALQGESFANVEISKPAASPGDPPKILIASYEPVRDETGEILGVCAAVADITLLKQQEVALRESEDHYRHTVELNPQIPWLMDPEGNNILVSSRWTAITGISAEQTRNLGWLDALHPDDRDAAFAATQSALKSGDPLDIEYRARSENGWIWMRSRGFPRRDAEGRIIRWYGSVESIDEHKRSLDELRCSEARLRAVFEAAPVGIGLFESATHRLLSANPRLEEVIGFRYTPGMIWSSSKLRCFDTRGNLLPAERMPLARCIRSGETTNSEELLLERSNGSSLWISITVAPVRLENGTQWGAVVAVQDIDGTRREHRKLLELTRVLESVAALPAVTAGLST